MSEYQEPRIDVAPHAGEFENSLGLFPGGWTPSSTVAGASPVDTSGIFLTPSSTFVLNAVFIAPDPVMQYAIQVGVCCAMCGAVHRVSIPGTVADRGEPIPRPMCEEFRSSFHNVSVYVVLHPSFRPGAKMDRHKLGAEYERHAMEFLSKWERGARVKREAVRDFEVLMQNAEKFHKPKLNEHFIA